jgi:ParB family chromosome partitioning protein
MSELEESIKQQGLLQPVLLRPTDHGYQLVAGERRLRAFTAVYGEDSEIPALVRNLSDEEADRAALTENTDREDMTAVEEAEAAANILGQCQGNRDEAAARLGWPRAKLDKRLALMYASDNVRAALQAGKILLGHAELLAACRKESQDAAVAHLLKQEKQMTVAELRAYLEANALQLGSAIFDKADCTACHHNSGNQSTLFAEAISSGRCTNKLCFEGKTEAKINAQAEALKSEYQVVRVVRPGENLTVITLVAEGPKGVGEEQAKACRVCKDYGAVISTVPDKLGKEFKGMCMNVQCNSKHVAEKQEAEKAALQAAQAPEPADGADASDATSGKAEKKAKPAAKTAASSEPAGRVKEYREKLWRLIFERAVAKLPVAANRAVLLAICMTRPSVMSSHKLTNALEGVVGKTSGLSGPAKVLADIASLEQAQLGQALNQIASCVDDTTLAIADVTGILKFYDIKVKDHWTLCKEFLTLLTKNEIDVVCEELGIKAAIGKDYAKLRNAGKDEFVTAALGVKDFDYRGRVPKIVNY